MGTEVSVEDITNIQHLCDQVISISEYRTSLNEYLRNRMSAIAPNLTVMVGELVGARLIAHAGSLLSLAKHPASTVQILGAEKALFRALKTKHDTPKYGLIYHASLVGQAAPKFKGKISRLLASKTALATRMDALGDTDGATIAFEGRKKVEQRLAMLEGGKVNALSGTGKGKSAQQKLSKSASKSYNPDADNTLAQAKTPKKDKKKETKEETKEIVTEEKKETEESAEEKKKKKKDKKKRKRDEEAAAAAVPTEAAPAVEEEGEKKKKKKKNKESTA